MNYFRFKNNFGFLHWNRRLRLKNAILNLVFTQIANHSQRSVVD